jgi:hypothetical protein
MITITTTSRETATYARFLNNPDHKWGEGIPVEREPEPTQPTLF